MHAAIVYSLYDWNADSVRKIINSPGNWWRLETAIETACQIYMSARPPPQPPPPPPSPPDPPATPTPPLPPCTAAWVTAKTFECYISFRSIPTFAWGYTWNSDGVRYPYCTDCVVVMDYKCPIWQVMWLHRSTSHIQWCSIVICLQQGGYINPSKLIGFGRALLWVQKCLSDDENLIKDRYV